MKYVALITGGASSEREISLRSAKNVLQILGKAMPIRIFDFPNDRESFLQERANLTVVIPLIHGRGGEDGSLQGFLETLGIPYLFSGIQAHALALDKAKTKDLLSLKGVSTPHSELAIRGSMPTYCRESVVKPLDGGSSVATTVVRSSAELADAVEAASAHSTFVLVEDFINGDEFTVSVIETPNGLRALPVVSIQAKGSFFTFANKYDPAALATEACPAQIPKEWSDKLQQAALTAHAALGCRHLSRSDFIVDENGTPWFLEINTIPGMTETSLFPKALKADGKDLAGLFKAWIYETAGSS